MNENLNQKKSGSTKDWMAFDRYDRWGLAGLVALVCVGVLIAEVVGPLIDWARGKSLQVPFTSPVKVPALDAAKTTYTDATYHVIINTPTAAQRFLSLLPGLAISALVVLGAWLLLRVMRDISTGSLHPAQRRPAASARDAGRGWSRADWLRRAADQNSSPVRR